MAPTQSFELTLVVVPDKKTGRYTAFFAQFPEAIAVGENENQAQDRLFEVFTVMMLDRKNEVMKRHISGADYISKPANLVFA